MNPLPLFPNQRLLRQDYWLLLAASLLLFGLAILPGGSLTGHQAVLPQNSREMLASGNWLIPTVGGEPWLERPPLPDWLLCGAYALFGTSQDDRVARLPAAAMAIATLLLVGWMAGVLLGRRLALLACLALATMYEFYLFASNPEADIFLCAIVTAALALFVKLEFGGGPAQADQRTSFLGGRSWTMLAFFFVLGLTNQAKGLIFGTLMVVVPAGGFLILTGSLTRIRRYVWLWGWLVFLAVSLAWPVAVYVRYPEIIDLWVQHYLGRFCRGYIREPVWYYLVALPAILFPWTWPALLGLWVTRKEALRQPGSPERFLWCWAILPPLVFSIPQGKHHHYLLHCLPAWAILSAPGAVLVWHWLRQAPHMPKSATLIWRSPVLWSLLMLAIPGDVVLVLLRRRIPCPDWAILLLLAIWTLVTLTGGWLLGQRDRRLVLGGIFAVLLVSWTTWTVCEASFDAYRHDHRLLLQARQHVPEDEPLFVFFDWYRPLETFWLLYYADPQVILVRDTTHCYQHPLREKTVCILARRMDRKDLERVGIVEEVLESQHTRGERQPEERRVLFRLHFHSQVDPQVLPSLVRYKRGIIF